MGKSIHARIAECEEKIAMYQARYDKADTEAKRTKAMKSINAWNERLEEATEMSLKSIEKSEKSSVRSTVPLGNELWEPSQAVEDKEVTFADEYTNILASECLPDNSARHRELLKKIRAAEITCGLMHDMDLEEASIEVLEEHLKSLIQQSARQSKTASSMAANMYVGLLINGPTIINHYSDDLGFYIDRDCFSDALKAQETMENIRSAFSEIFEDSPEIRELFSIVSRGLPKLAAVTVMAIAPSVRLGSAPKKI